MEGSGSLDKAIVSTRHSTCSLPVLLLNETQISATLTYKQITEVNRQTHTVVCTLPTPTAHTIDFSE